MVAYSFQSRFRAPILAGTKRQTIRADRKRHAREGEQVQLYTGMRTRQCAIIGRAVCIGVEPVTIRIDGAGFAQGGDYVFGQPNLDAFARADGFADWADMQAFWRAAHPGATVFSGLLIRWDEFNPEAPDAP